MTTTKTEREAVEEGFERLREHCDPRGWGLLDALKTVMLNEIDAREVAVAGVELLASAQESRKV